jgi:hypothetical protein
MADQDRLPWWDDIQNLMSAIHAPFGPLGSIIRVLHMAFRSVLAAFHLGLHNFSETLFLAYLSAVFGQDIKQLDPVRKLFGIPDFLPSGPFEAGIFECHCGLKMLNSGGIKMSTSKTLTSEFGVVRMLDLEEFLMLRDLFSTQN